MREYNATGKDLRPTENPDIMTGDEALTGILDDQETDQAALASLPGVTTSEEEKRRKMEHETQAAVMQMGRQVISESTTYLDSNYRATWQKNLSLFHSKHPAGSKYHTEAYKSRSKAFRPLTRTNVRRIEAAASSAFFSTNSPTKISARNPSDPKQIASAAIMNEIMEYRLGHEDMNYYQLLIGAIQDAQVMGACVGHNYWSYKKDANGDLIEDTLKSDLVPLERWRVHPDSDWLDPVKSSPYIVHEMDMSVDDVRLGMINDGWHWAPDSMILSATRDYDTTEATREKGKTSENKGTAPLPGHTVVSVYKIIYRELGIDYIFYMLGNNHLLTMPKPLKDVNPDGMRNYSFGVMILETHRPIPSGNVEIGADLQALANDTSNQRIDNVRLAMNKRWILRRGKNIDVRALMRNVPGGATFTQDPESDIKEITTADVTGSAYKEQELINLDLDGINGNFNSASVQSNRAMNETVGGMELMTSDSNQMTEYIIKLFAETFVKRTNRQQLKLIQAYETDTTLMLYAATKNKDLLLKYGIDQITDDLLSQELTCKVDVGIDATNPEKQLQKLMAGLNISAGLGNPIDPLAVHKAAFGLLGYGDGEMFLQAEEDQGQKPPTEQEAAAAEKQAQDQVKLQIEQLKGDIAMQKQQLELAVKDSELQVKHEVEMAKLALTEKLTMAELHTKLGIAKADDTTKRDIAAVDNLDKESNRAFTESLERLKAGWMKAAQDSKSQPAGK